jgi:hypothetical protein
MAVFDLQTLRGMDAGGLGQQWGIGQKMVVDDILDNTAEGKKRKLILELEYEPIRRVNGNSMDVIGTRITGVVKVKLPDRKTYPIECSIKQNGSLVFDPDSQRVAVETSEDE